MFFKRLNGKSYEPERVKACFSFFSLLNIFRLLAPSRKGEGQRR
jgi:hypothetical protein